MTGTLASGDHILDGFDMSELTSPDFKEDSVREEIIKPILNALGYFASGKNRIRRSRKLQHPFVMVGSSTRQINNFPDYLLTVGDKYVWVLDAKDPHEEIKTGKHREQVYFYAIHPDVNVTHYALCNGKEFAAFAINEAKPRLYFHISELAKHWKELVRTLSPAAFGEKAEYPKLPFDDVTFDYMAAKTLAEVPSKRQGAKRHYGVHGYFTRQPYDIVQAYIKNFTQPGDVVLDPFGGYGVTALEALILGRKGIHVDLNPLSIFILKGLTAPVNIAELQATFNRIISSFDKNLPQTDKEIENVLETLPYPKDVILPRNSDVQTIQELFTPKQLAQLAYLKSLIVKVKDENIRNSLLLCFSSSLNKFNRTFHYTKSIGGGDSGMFRYYRYRIAPEPGDNSLSSIFRTKFKKLLAAKKEIAPLITTERLKDANIYKGNAADLIDIPNESIDYIYTDPPYGAKIPYLDLSIMWNAWLDLDVSESDYQAEAIEGGEHRKTKKEYFELISKAITNMYRVLKYDRWMSFVFQHKDPAYWDLIVETAQRAGFEYMGTVRQSIGQNTFKKRQNPFTVLRGQLIINFKKVRNPQALIKVQLGYETAQIVMQTIEAVIAQNQGATLEEIYDELTIRAMELDFLHELVKEPHNIPGLLRDNFDYNEEKKVYQVRKNTKFKTQIPVKARIKYYLLSYMRQMQRQNVVPNLDDIILNIMPLLKNGTTPEHQTIIGVLENMAERYGEGWRLIEDQQLKLNLADITAYDPPKKSPVSSAASEQEDKRKKF
jgi:DNA modification methylase